MGCGCQRHVMGRGEDAGPSQGCGQWAGGAVPVDNSCAVPPRRQTVRKVGVAGRGAGRTVAIYRTRRLWKKRRLGANAGTQAGVCGHDTKVGKGEDKGEPEQIIGQLQVLGPIMRRILCNRVRLMRACGSAFLGCLLTVGCMHALRRGAAHWKFACAHVLQSPALAAEGLGDALQGTNPSLLPALNASIVNSCFVQFSNFGYTLLYYRPPKQGESSRGSRAVPATNQETTGRRRKFFTLGGWAATGGPWGQGWAFVTGERCTGATA